MIRKIQYIFIEIRVYVYCSLYHHISFNQNYDDDMKFSKIYLFLPSFLFMFFPTPDISQGLRDVRVTIPTAVKKGDNANLICNYDLEGDALYSIKWYKGKREFYRYTPRETPPMKTFSATTGIQVEVSAAYPKVFIEIFSKFSFKFL
jgi:hypothetical protein